MDTARISPKAAQCQVASVMPLETWSISRPRPALAEFSEKSARGIQEVVNEIQNQVKVVAGETEVAAKNGREQVEKAQVITQALIKLADAFAEIETSCAEIQES